MIARAMTESERRDEVVNRYSGISRMHAGLLTECEDADEYTSAPNVLSASELADAFGTNWRLVLALWVHLDTMDAAAWARATDGFHGAVARSRSSGQPTPEEELPPEVSSAVKALRRAEKAMPLPDFNRLPLDERSSLTAMDTIHYATMELVGGAVPCFLCCFFTDPEAWKKQHQSDKFAYVSGS